MISSNNQDIAKNTLFLYIRMAFSLVISLYTSRIILKVLGIEDYGVYNVVAGFVSMFAFLNTALSSSIQRYYNYENGINGSIGFRNVYITSIFIQIIISVISLVLAETIGLWYVKNYLVVPVERIDASLILFHVSVLSMVLVIMQVPYSSAILAKEKMDYYAFVGIVDVILKLVIVFIIKIISYDKLVSYAWLVALVSLFDFLLYYIYSKRKFSEIKFKFKFNRTLFGEMLKFSGWSAFNGFSQIVKNQGINIVLNLFFGPVVNAARGISYQVKSALIGFVGNITVASRPQMVEEYAVGNKDRSIRLMSSTSKICFLLLLLMALPISVEVEYILNIWLKNIVPEHTQVFTILVLLTTLVDILQTPISIMVYATGRIAKYNLYTSLLGLLILPIAFIALKLGAVPEFVYVFSFLISIGIQIISVTILTKLTGYSSMNYIKSVVLPLTYVTLLSCIIPIIAHQLLPYGFLRFVVVLVVSTGAIVSLGYLFALNNNERLMVLQIAKKFLSKMHTS